METIAPRIWSRRESQGLCWRYRPQEQLPQLMMWRSSWAAKDEANLEQKLDWLMLVRLYSYLLGGWLSEGHLFHSNVLVSAGVGSHLVDIEYQDIALNLGQLIPNFPRGQDSKTYIHEAKAGCRLLIDGLPATAESTRGTAWIDEEFAF